MLRKNGVYRYTSSVGGENIEFFPKEMDMGSMDFGSKSEEDDIHEIRSREKILEKMNKEF